MSGAIRSDNPLGNFDDWQDFVAESVYPDPQGRAKESYRNYESPSRDCVREFYRLHHINQTYDIGRGIVKIHCALTQTRYIWVFNQKRQQDLAQSFIRFGT